MVGKLPQNSEVGKLGYSKLFDREYLQGFFLNSLNTLEHKDPLFLLTIF